MSLISEHGWIVMVDTRIRRKFTRDCRRGGRMRYRNPTAKVDAHLTVELLIGHPILDLPGA